MEKNVKKECVCVCVCVYTCIIESLYSTAEISTLQMNYMSI